MCSIYVQGSPFSYCADLAEVELDSEGWGCTVRSGAAVVHIHWYTQWMISSHYQRGCIMPLVTISTAFRRFLDASSKLVRVDETLTVSNAREQHMTLSFQSANPIT